MNIMQAFGALLLGVGLGGLLVWLQQSCARRQFREDLEARIDQACFDRSSGIREGSAIKLVLRRTRPY